jgi:hypothetical protein
MDIYMFVSESFTIAAMRRCFEGGDLPNISIRLERCGRLMHRYHTVSPVASQPASQAIDDERDNHHGLLW